MPKVKPFKAIRYNTAKVKNIRTVVAPPYDVISEELQDELCRRDEHNFVKLELNKIAPSDNGSDNRYTRSKKLFESWMSKGILAEDSHESLYIYSLKYKKGAESAEQIGFIGLMGLELKGGNKVLPHENTLAAPKEDRLRLIRAINANLSPIFVLYEDKSHGLTGILKKFMSGNKPCIDIESDCVRHRVWALDDSKSVRKIEEAMARKDIFIADGHHRYEVSRMYFNETRQGDLAERIKDNARYMMVYFVEMDEKMLTILPAHRLVKDIGALDTDDILNRLSKFFQVEKAASMKAMLKKMSKLAKEHAFGMYLGKGRYYILRLKSIRDPEKAIENKPKEWKRLDVSILHQFIMQRVLGIRDDDDNVEFLKSAEETAKSVDNGRFRLAFFLNPTKVSDVKSIARIGERMPRKATYFYPKPLSGLVVNKF